MKHIAVQTINLCMFFAGLNVRDRALQILAVKSTRLAFTINIEQDVNIHGS